MVLLSSLLFLLLFAISDLSAQPIETRRDVMTSGSGSVADGSGRSIRGSLSQTAVGRLERGVGTGGEVAAHLVGFWYRGVAPAFVTRVYFPVIETNVETEITLPLTLEVSGSERPFFPRSFTARVRFNATLLHPIGNTPQCIEYDGSSCTIEITGTATAEGVIAELPFLTALGDAEKTAVEILSFTWEARGEENISVAREDGEVLLLDVCREGGEIRLIHSGSASRMVVRPNPARERTTIEYVSNALGEAEIILVDMLGKEVARVAEGELRPNVLYRTELDLSGIPSGSYIVLCRLPSDLLTYRLIIPE